MSGTSGNRNTILTLMAQSHWPKRHSVCFPNRYLGVQGSERIIFRKHSMCSRSILDVRLRTDAYGTTFGSSNHLLCMFKIIFNDHPNVASMCIREVFEKHSRSIRHVRKTFGKHASCSWCIRNENVEVLDSVCFPNTPNGHLEYDECFPNVFSILRKACGKSSVHSRLIRRVRKAFGKHTKSVRKQNLLKSTCGKYSVYSETILKTFGKQTESIL